MARLLRHRICWNASCWTSRREHPWKLYAALLIGLLWARRSCFVMNSSSPEAAVGRREMLAAGVTGALLLPQGVRAEQAVPMLLSNISASAPPLPSWASDLDAYPQGFMAAGKEPDIRWLPLGKETNPLGSSLEYPSWLEGQWEVQYLKQDVHFPAGITNVGLSAAGIVRGSIIRLADVGAEPRCSWRFVRDERDKVRADWIYTLPRILTGFMNGAEIVSTAQGTSQDGPGYEVKYKEPPGLFGGGRQLSASLTWLAGDTWEDPERQSFLSVEWQRQRGEIETPTDVFDYKVLTVLRRDGEQGIVGLVRFACYLQPVDDLYVTTGGKAAVVYDYQVKLTPRGIGFI